jgi:hypothetical protein
MLLIVQLLTVFFISPANAAPKDFPPIGPHYPFLRVEKSENPQNILIAYTKLDPKTCEFVKDPEHKDQAFFDFYWLMDGTRYKRVHPLIVRAIRQRFKWLGQAADHRSFQLEMTDLKELKDAPKRAVLTVAAQPDCQVTTSMQLGGEEMRLTRVYSESEHVWWPPFHRLKAVTLTGERGERRFVAR